MVVFPNAKINIGLNVLNKREDGFHNLESIFYPIYWCDILEINKSDTVEPEGYQFKTSGIAIDGDLTNNLVVKAFKLIKNQYHIPDCKIHLHKQIPMGAGLGGGSADAAFTLTLLNNLFELSISLENLIELADTLGSDCPFFIKNTPQFVSGKGDIMTDINFDLSGYFIKLVNPNIHISTKVAFNNLDLPQPIQNFNLKNLTPQLLFDKNQKVVNDFEKGIFNLHPKLLKIKQQLIKEGALYASMTGTGSTIYGIYQHQPKLSFKHKNYTEKVFKLQH